jgi:hypothetical protein
MSAQMTEIARVMKPSNRRPARTRTVSTRVTEAEYIALQKQAWSTGQDRVRLGARVHRTATGKRFPNKFGGTSVY